MRAKQQKREALPRDDNGKSLEEFEFFVIRKDPIDDAAGSKEVTEMTGIDKRKETERRE
jgi:hypothetical protein